MILFYCIGIYQTYQRILWNIQMNRNVKRQWLIYHTLYGKNKNTKQNKAEKRRIEILVTNNASAVYNSLLCKIKNNATRQKKIDL